MVAYFLMYAITAYGGFVASGVVEEKPTRIVEIVLAADWATGQRFLDRRLSENYWRDVGDYVGWCRSRQRKGRHD